MLVFYLLLTHKVRRIWPVAWNKITCSSFFLTAIRKRSRFKVLNITGQILEVMTMLATYHEVNSKIIIILTMTWSSTYFHFHLALFFIIIVINS